MVGRPWRDVEVTFTRRGCLRDVADEGGGQVVCLMTCLPFGDLAIDSLVVRGSFSMPVNVSTPPSRCDAFLAAWRFIWALHSYHVAFLPCLPRLVVTTMGARNA